MVKIFLLLMFLVNAAIGILVVFSYKEMWHDLYEIKTELNEVEKETREVKKDSTF